jgi:hypothetical protein
LEASYTTLKSAFPELASVQGAFPVKAIESSHGKGFNK